MPAWKEGDKVRIVKRETTEEDRKENRYFDHMAGLSGTVENFYSDQEIAVKIDPPSLAPISKKIHETATTRMRDKFASSVGEEQRKQLAPEELNFNVNYVLLVRGKDLEKA